MNGWATFWAVTLVAALILFALVAVMVTIGGVRDIKSLFANIQRRNGADEPEAGPELGSESGTDAAPESGPQRGPEP